MIDTTFSTDLEEAIGIYNHSEAKGSISLKKTESQADPLIAKWSLDIISTAIISNDSDFLVHNPMCLQIFKWTLPRKGEPTNIILATAHIDTVHSVTNILRSQYKSLDKEEIFCVCKCPIFEIEENVHCRALVACAIGNDYWEGGQYKFGVVAALGVVKSAQKKKNVSSRYKFYTDAIIGFATNRERIKYRKSIADFANAFLYEPANEICE